MSPIPSVLADNIGYCLCIKPCEAWWLGRRLILLGYDGSYPPHHMTPRVTPGIIPDRVLIEVVREDGSIPESRMLALGDGPTDNKSESFSSSSRTTRVLRNGAIVVGRRPDGVSGEVGSVA